jgi:uncharacterized alkaline shock family protein YloU
MTTNNRPPGKTTIAPEVLVSMTKLAALNVPGVLGMSDVPADAETFFTRRSEGVKVEVENNAVFVDLYLLFANDVNVREVSRNVQNQVARAVQDMVGMEVGHINIHVEDILYQ